MGLPLFFLFLFLSRGEWVVGDLRLRLVRFGGSVG